LLKGYSGVEISNILNLDQDTITQWQSGYLNRIDEKNWLNDAYQPYLGKLSFHSVSLLRRYTDTFMVGNKKELLSFVEKSFSVSYSLSGFNRLLHRIGLSYQSIHKLPGKCPVDRQAAWIKSFEEKLQKTDFSSEVILFMDSVHPTHNSVYTKVWTKIGVPRWIFSNTGRERLNIAGAYNPMEPKLIMIEGSSINGKITVELFQKCLEKYSDKQTITIYLDNASYHKCEEVKNFIAGQDKIRLAFLPPYSPNLNLIERLWKFGNEKVLNLKYYPEFCQFKEKILDFYKHIQLYATELKERITFNFQTFQPCKI
jgi:transposase